MTWLVLLLLSWLWAGTPLAQMWPNPGPGHAAFGGGGGGPFTDTFTRADGALGANWTLNLQTVSISGNAVMGTTGDDAMASYTAQNLGTDHFSQVTLTGITGSDNGGPCVRVSGTSAYCYHAFPSEHRELYRINAGTFTVLITTPFTGQVNAVNDTLKLAVSGTGATVTLTMTRNGTLDTGLVAGGTFADTAGTRLTTGNFAGLGMFGSAWRFDTFTCNSGG